MHLTDRWRHEAGRRRRGAAMADEVGNVTELAGTLLLAAHVLPSAAHGPRGSGVMRRHASRAVKTRARAPRRSSQPHARRRIRARRLGLPRTKELLEASGRSFDATGKDGLPPEERVDEQMRIWQAAGRRPSALRVARSASARRLMVLTCRVQDLGAADRERTRDGPRER